ncbi:MAG: hypothetical protein GY931_21845, partial [Maribacter sp.]|nr:hypothetical protein [Maribacter sp.]
MYLLRGRKVITYELRLEFSFRINHLKQQLCGGLRGVWSYQQPKKFIFTPLFNSKLSFGELTNKFGLEENTLDFLGHSVALYTDNSYVN